MKIKTKILNLTLTIICLLLVFGLAKLWAAEPIDYQICGLPSVVCPFEACLPIESYKTHQRAEFEQKTGYSVEDVKQIIAVVANQEGVDPDLMIRIAFCESSFRPFIVGEVNSDDRGLYQLSRTYHPEVSDEQAFDPWWSARWTANEIKNGNLWEWSASFECWAK